MKKLEEIFHVEYPKTLIFSEMIPCNNGINFVSSKGDNNGVVCKVERNLAHKEYPANIITVPLKGTVLMAYLQPEPCYVAHQIAVLTPKEDLSVNQLMYYCLCIRQNRFRYNYGRQADKTLRSVLLPHIDDAPVWVQSLDICSYDKISESISSLSIMLEVDKWKPYKYSQLFDIKKGKRVTRLEMPPGETAFVSAIDTSNGIREHAGVVPVFDANTITVNYNGNGVAEAFYQDQPFWASDDVNVLYPKFVLNKYIAMFIITLIRQDKYRFSYGRKWHKERMESSIIRLPSLSNGTPDFMFMEKYVKSLSYSASI